MGTTVLLCFSLVGQSVGYLGHLRFFIFPFELLRLGVMALGRSFGGRCCEELGYGHGRYITVEALTN